MTKAELRKIYLEKRRAIPPDEHAELSRKIAARFFEAVHISPVKTVHCFISLKHAGEVETASLFRKLWKDFPNVRTFAPRIDERSGEIDAIAFGSESELIQNRRKIPEPVGGEAADPLEIDVVVVPLICFDELGFRVGYGKGFYDKFLSKCRPDCLKIGLSFFPPVERIDDANEYDIPLDLCIMPDRTYRSRRRFEQDAQDTQDTKVNC